MKKKIFSLLIAVVTVFSMYACASRNTALVLSFENDKTTFEEVSDVLRSRLERLYISNTNIDITEISAGELNVRINGTSLSDEQLKILLYSESLSVKDAKGNTVLSAEDFMDCSVGFDPSKSDGTGENGCYVKLTFTDDGAEKFKELTRRISSESEEKNRKLFFFSGKELIYEPVINSTVISRDIMLTGEFELAECILSSAQIFSAIKPLPCLVEVKLE